MTLNELRQTMQECVNRRQSMELDHYHAEKVMEGFKHRDDYIEYLERTNKHLLELLKSVQKYLVTGEIMDILKVIREYAPDAAEKEREQ